MNKDHTFAAIAHGQTGAQHYVGRPDTADARIESLERRVGAIENDIAGRRRDLTDMQRGFMDMRRDIQLGIEQMRREISDARQSPNPQAVTPLGVQTVPVNLTPAL